MTDASGYFAGVDPAGEGKNEPLMVRMLRGIGEPVDKRLQRNRELWRADPIAYFVDRLRMREGSLRWSAANESIYNDHRWDGTVDPFVVASESLARYQDVGVESGTGTGKTFWGAATILWFLECWEDAQVITLAPKKDQLTLHIWKEAARLWPRIAADWPLATLTTLKLRMRGGIDEGWTATGFPVQVRAGEEAATKAQGFHAEHMLFIFEETPGIDLAVMTAVENTCTADHNLRLALGNPDAKTDSLHKHCVSPGVVHVRVSSLDHPNVVLGNPNYIVGAVSQRSIDKRAVKYGKGSRMYESRVRGISPDQDKEALIRVEHIRRAQSRFSDAELRAGARAYGLDVANSPNGDSAAHARGIGATCLEVTSFVCDDANALARKIKILAEAEAVLPANIGVDTIGVGVGTYNEFKRLGWYVTSIQSSAKQVETGGEERFLNLRAQMWWKTRTDLEEGTIAMPEDEELEEDLTVVRWTTKGGKIKVESKDDLKKRLGRSPDKGDAFVYWNWVRANPGTTTGLSASVAL